MLTWKGTARASRRWWFEGVRWRIGAAAAQGSRRLPGFDLGGGADDRGRCLVGCGEEAKGCRLVVVARPSVACGDQKREEKLRATWIVGFVSGG